MTERNCSRPDCNQRHKARGLCKQHYEALQRAGLPAVSAESLPGELWRPVRGYEGLYEVSNLARVRRLGGTGGAQKGYRILKPRIDHKGYVRLILAKGGRKRTGLVHALVAEAFLGSRPDGLQVNHKNGVKTDNRPSNLEWQTSAGNVQHAIRTGLRQPLRGERNGMAKLTQAQVQQIRNLHGTMSNPKIGARFGVSRSAVELIVKGERWA